MSEEEQKILQKPIKDLDEQELKKGIKLVQKQVQEA